MMTTHSERTLNMPFLGPQLDLERCPHCRIDRPNLQVIANHQNRFGRRESHWNTYECARCRGLVLAYADGPNLWVHQTFPSSPSVDSAIPERAREYLQQALDSTGAAPVGAIMLSASAVDAMLKERGYRDGNLYSRIDKAAQDHVITSEMAQWAHQVRLDANDQRHVDEGAALPSRADAQRSIDFASALAQFLFVLPALVERGIEQAAEQA